MKVDIETLSRLYAEGFTAEEIAHEMGWSRSTIECAIYRNGLSKTRPGNTNKVGEAHNRAKFSEKDVIDILSIRLAGELTQREIAEVYAVSTAAVWAICAGKSWNHPDMKAIKYLRNKVRLAGINHTGRDMKK